MVRKRGGTPVITDVRYRERGPVARVSFGRPDNFRSYSVYLQNDVLSATRRNMVDLTDAAKNMTFPVQELSATHIGIIGLCCFGLPLAVEFSKHFPMVASTSSGPHRGTSRRARHGRET
jgi:hypothetical protein